ASRGCVAAVGLTLSNFGRSGRSAVVVEPAAVFSSALVLAAPCVPADRPGVVSCFFAAVPEDFAAPAALLSTELAAPRMSARFAARLSWILPPTSEIMPLPNGAG